VVEPDQSNNLDTVSVSLVFQVRAIDKKRLKNKIGKIGQAGMDLLKRNLKEIMGLLDKEEQEKIEPSQ
jgi:mRNA-degrading endonuclease toxin of MazEF toxin-antitoxin module